MRQLSISLLFCALLLPLACQAKTQATPTTTIPMNTPIEIAPDLSVRQIQPGVFIITHAFPWPANSLLVAMPNAELILIDTPYTPKATNLVLKWTRSHFGDQSITAINTGFHVDNLGGNRALIDAGIPVYGSDRTVELLAERGEDSRALMVSWLPGEANTRFREAHASIPYIPPTQTFPLNDGLTLDFGGETVQIYFPGETHSPDNVVVYFPARKLLFGGCMILAGEKVGNTADANLAAWPDSVRKLGDFDFETLIPGHGDRFDAGLVDHTLALLKE